MLNRVHSFSLCLQQILYKNQSVILTFNTRQSIKNGILCISGKDVRTDIIGASHPALNLKVTLFFFSLWSQSGNPSIHSVSFRIYSHPTALIHTKIKPMRLFFPYQVQYKTTKQSDCKVIDHFDPEQTMVIHTCAKV